MKPQPSTTPRPKLGSSIDVKRVAQVVAVLVVGVAVAVWGISRTFTPGPVTRLEPPYVDAGPPAPPVSPATPAEPRRSTPPVAAERDAAAFSANAARRPVIVVPPPQVQPPPREPGSVIPVAPIGRAATPAPRDGRLPPPELRFETSEDVVDSSVYSAADPGIEPPVVLYPQQLGRVPVGLRRDEIAFVEVVVNEEGRVLRVKSLDSPATLDESMVLTMSLSAAKSWRFQPARKDGRAVKFRQVLPVSLR